MTFDGYHLCDLDGDEDEVLLSTTERHEPRAVVPPGWWQSAEPRTDEHGFTLVACVVAPGFEFEDFETRPGARRRILRPLLGQRSHRPRHPGGSTDARMTTMDTEDLLAHAAWLRQLAMSLVRDPGTVDDLVQTTWLAAIEHPPGPGGPPRPWLGTVLRNAWRQIVREGSRRRRRERAAARPERDTPSPAELASRLEAQRILAAAVASLHEADRTIVLLRHQEGLSSAEIARRRGEPAGTVRWRLKKALDALRRRLDEEHGGDGKAWVVALIPLVDRESLDAGGTASRILRPRPRRRLLPAAAAMVLLVLAVWLTRGAGDPPEVAEAADARVAASSSGDRLVVASVPRPAGDVPLPAGGPRPPAGRDLVEETVARSRIHVRFIDPTGIPIAGVSLRAGPCDRRRVLAASDERGSISVEVSPGLRTVLEALAPGRALWLRKVEIDPGSDHHLGDVVLGPGGEVTGRVVDSEGESIPGARVAADDVRDDAVLLKAAARFGPVFDPDTVPFTRTDADGRYRLRGIAPGYRRIWAWGSGYAPAFGAPVEVLAGAAFLHPDLRLPAMPPGLVGVVRAPDGSPAEGVAVHVTYVVKDVGLLATSTLTNEAGRFRVDLTGAEEGTVRVDDPQRRGAAPPVARFALGEEVTIRLGIPRTIEVRVRDAEGRPLETVEVAILEAASDHPIRWPREEAAPGGVLRLPAPGEPFRLRIAAPGHTTVERGPYGPGSAPKSLEVALYALPGIRGRVLAAGFPVSGARIEAHRLVPPDLFRRVGPFRVRLGSPLPARAVADEDGHFRIVPRTAGRIVLRVEADGFAAGESAPIDLDPRVGREDVVVALTRGGTIEGRVLLPAGESPAGAVVGASRGDLHPRSIRVGPDGRFLFDGLSPGPWFVTRLAEEARPHRGGSGTERLDRPLPFPVSCVVRDGAVVRCDLDLRHATPAALVGHVSVDGARPGIVRATLRTTHEGPVRTGPMPAPSATLDPEGRFRLTASREGPHVLELSFLERDTVVRTLRVDVSLVPGETRWSLALVTGLLLGGDVDPESPGLIHVVDDVSTGRIETPIRVDDRGRFRVVVPAGPGRIVLGPDGDTGRILRRVEVPAGGEIRVRIR
jgi:RNA polymerase sigma factor (sigma-70 family)